MGQAVGPYDYQKMEIAMKDNEDVRRGKGFGFYVASKKLIYMIRCFACGKENYGPAVASGKCAWCEHDPMANIEQGER